MENRYLFEEVSLDSLKREPKHPVGIMGKTHYTFKVGVPKSHVDFRVGFDEGLSVQSFYNQQLKEVPLHAQGVRLVDRTDDEAILEITVAEPYLPVVHRTMSKVKSAVFYPAVEETDEGTQGAEQDNE